MNNKRVLSLIGGVYLQHNSFCLSSQAQGITQNSLKSLEEDVQAKDKHEEQKSSFFEEGLPMSSSNSPLDIFFEDPQMETTHCCSKQQSAPLSLTSHWDPPQTTSFQSRVFSFLTSKGDVAVEKKPRDMDHFQLDPRVGQLQRGQPDISLEWGGIWLRKCIKRFIYSQLGLQQSLGVLLGNEQPLVRFRVENDPPSVFYNFRIRPEKLEEFKKILNLDPGFELVPMDCLEGNNDPQMLVSLNVYRVSGITNGLRAEWSVYVDDGSGKPRFMVIDARSSAYSMDPEEIITTASRVEHEADDVEIKTEIGALEESFSTVLPRPKKEAMKYKLNRVWVEANDYIYWRNGVCDRAFYDASFFNANLWKVDPTEIKVNDQTQWSSFIDPVPYEVLVYDDALELIVSPWWNVDKQPNK